MTSGAISTSLGIICVSNSKLADGVAIGVLPLCPSVRTQNADASLGTGLGMTLTVRRYLVRVDGVPVCVEVVTVLFN